MGNWVDANPTNPPRWNWRERAAFQRSAFGRSTAGNDVVATIFIRLFLFFPPRFFSSPSRPFLIEGVLGSKNLFSKVAWNAQKPRGRHISRPRRPFWGPLAAILDFAGGAALQAVRHCRRCGVAGSERVPPSPLGWYHRNVLKRRNLET